MTFEIQKLDAKVWFHFSEHAHRACFNEIKPKDWDRIDYALLAVNDAEDPIGYMTCRELDAHSVYWQYGGAFKPIEKTIYPVKVYDAFINWHRGKYERVGTYIENTNRAMLKMAARSGFLITGVRSYQGKILLEHLLEFKENAWEPTEPFQTC